MPPSRAESSHAEPSPEDWPRVSALLDAALDLPPAERAALLDEACGGDAALRARVEEMLAACGEVEGALERPVAAVAAGLIDAGDGATSGGATFGGGLEGRRVGPYRLVRALGEGGMGSVYLAERADDAFHKQVAVKLIRGGFASAEVRERFRTERQILATLEHPNIARLLDGGMTDETFGAAMAGHPYLVMEYVAGEPLDEYCDRRRLAIADRVRLFASVCAAVQYAHEQQVVHRDLKPSNILVAERRQRTGPDAAVKLLDFGIAKLLDEGPAGGARRPETRTGAHVMTPEYASPEQIRNERVTPASDVYALGVVLCELLTGRRPYVLATRSPAEIQRVILEGEPERPSALAARRVPGARGDDDPNSAPAHRSALRGLTVDRHRKLLAGDLDAIVLKALRKEPERRYESAEALRQDLERYLDGRPVAAHTGAWTYRAAKRVRRHRVVLASAAVVLLLAAVLLTLYTTRMDRAGRSAAAPERGAVVAVGRIVDHRRAGGAEAFDLGGPLADMLATNLARAPRLRVLSSARLHEVAHQLGGDSSAALAGAARHVGATELVDGALFALADGQLRLDLRRVDLRTGDVLLAHTVVGRDAFALVDSGTARLVAGYGAPAPNGSIADVTTGSLVAYRFYEEGMRAFSRGDAASAARYFDSALREDSTFAMAALYGALAKEPGTRGGIDLLTRASRLASQATDRERLIIGATAASVTASPALAAIAETLATRYPDEVDGHLYRGLGLERAGRYLEAVAPLERALAMDSLSLVRDAAKCSGCRALTALGYVYELLDSLDARERLARRWIRLQPGEARPWSGLAWVLARVGQHAEAEAALRRVAEIDASALDPYLALQIHMFAGDYASAERQLRAQLAAGDAAREQNARWWLVIVLRHQGRMADALAVARQFRAAEHADRGVDPVAIPHDALPEALVLLESGRGREAAALFERMGRYWLRGQDVPWQSRTRAWHSAHAADAYASVGDTTALRRLADTTRVYGAQSNFVRDHRLHHHVEGLLHALGGRPAEAAAAFARARFSAAFGYARTTLEHGRALVRAGRPRDAVAVLQPALRSAFDGNGLYATHTELEEALARAWDAAGRPDSAAGHWRAVASAWAGGDPPYRARAAAARAAAARVALSTPALGPPPSAASPRARTP